MEPSLPPRYRRLAVPLGIVGAVKIEASPWVEDNLWVLEVAERDTIIVGVIGNLEPDKPDFAEMLGRYHKNRLFRGIRYGNLWGRDITKQANNPAFIDGLKLLQQADLVLDTANPRVDLLQAIVRITRQGSRSAGSTGSPAKPRSRGGHASGVRRSAQRAAATPANLRQAFCGHPPRQRTGFRPNSPHIANDSIS